MWGLGYDSSNRNGHALAPGGLLRIIAASVVDDFSDHIGGRLQQARENAGLNVDDVIFRTRIPRSVIVALEAGDFSVFSSPTYAKSFLSQYSEFLGVEAGLWLDALQPVSLISGDTVTPLWHAAQPKKEARPPEHAATGGWLSAVSLLVVSCAFVLAAVKGYEFFESRFGVELGPDPGSLDEPTTFHKPPAPAMEPKPLPELVNDEFSQPVPRARIVK